MAESDEFEPNEEAKAEPEKKSETRKRRAEPKIEANKVEPNKAEANKVEAAKVEPNKADMNTKPKDDAEAGKALAPAGPPPLDPFLAAKAEEKIDSAPPPRPFTSRVLDYSAHIAIIVGLLGFAWTVSGYVINRPKSDAQVTTAKATSGKLSDMEELRLANVKMHEELKALKASVDTLRTTARRDTTPEQVRMLSAGLDNIKSSLAAGRSETGAAIAQLQGKVDKLGAGKIQALADRVSRLEHQTVDTASTASITRTETSRPDVSRADSAKSAATDSGKTPPKPPVKPASLASLGQDQAAPDDTSQVIQGWVVRDVYQGVALIEGKRGRLEVVPGVSIPGAGVVKSIERKGSGWVVKTSKGQLAYGGSPQREQRDYRRGGYGYGDGYGRRYRDDY